MKLTWGEPFWPGQDAAPAWPRLQTDSRCDVLIVGGGITGALIAYELTAAGRDVIVVDKRDPGRGSTSASTALLLYELDTPLHELVRMRGEAHAARAYRLGVEAIEHIGRLTRDLDDPCGFARRKSVYLASRPGDAETLREEFDCRRKHGLRVEFLSDAEISRRFSFSQPAAILSHDAAEVDPYRLTQALLRAAEGKGARVFAHTEVTRHERDGGRVTATTHEGRRLVARDVVIATGYEAAGAHGGGIATPRVTYCAASEPLDRFDGWWDRAMIWETARPYLYLRTTPDGRALIGGEDDDRVGSAADAGHVERKCAELVRRFNRMFPAIRFEPAFGWAGLFETTPDGLPYVGRWPQHPDALYGLGYGGNGITFAVIAAGILRDLLLGRDNPDAELFRFDRNR